MAIYMDKPTREGWAHMISDLPGKQGQEELFSFARDAFLPRRRHRTGTYAEHIDIRGSEIHRAETAGAQVIMRRQLAKILKTKKLADHAAGRISSLANLRIPARPLSHRP